MCLVLSLVNDFLFSLRVIDRRWNFPWFIHRPLVIPKQIRSRMQRKFRNNFEIVFYATRRFLSSCWPTSFNIHTFVQRGSSFYPPRRKLVSNVLYFCQARLSPRLSSHLSKFYVWYFVQTQTSIATLLKFTANSIGISLARFLENSERKSICNKYSKLGIEGIWESMCIESYIKMLFAKCRRVSI